jgi:hypothetical protein
MSRPFTQLAEIERLVARFLDCTLPCAEWTHRAHLTVGLCHARDYPLHEALDRVRAGIKRYNVTCGVVDSPTRGYHETITRFYMLLVGKYLAECEDRADWVAVTNRLFELHGHKDAPLAYYTRERLMSAEARAGWLPPDLRPLAELSAGG